MTDDARYPIGKFAPKTSYSPQDVTESVKQITLFPEKLEVVVKTLTDKQLNSKYRTDGWTLRQVIHHIADSHMNAYIRTKWALTETEPLIKDYNERAWAETCDNKIDPTVSLQIIKYLHIRWVALLNGINPSEFGRKFLHPKRDGLFPLDRMIALYAWHGEHHLQHIINGSKMENG